MEVLILQKDLSVVMFRNLQKKNNLYLNIFELNFYQDQNKWKHKLIPIEISKNDEPDRIIELKTYKNH